MNAEQTRQFEQIRNLEDKLATLLKNFWVEYSSFNSWQFWFLISVAVLSLIGLYFFIDRKKALLIGFFGFCVHVFYLYLNEIGLWNAFWSYPYKIIPFLPAFFLEAALVPVVFMLVFQWTLNHNKNYYLYATGVCLILAFLWGPFMALLGLFKIETGIIYFYLFLEYVMVMLVSKWITNVFVHFQREPEHPFKTKMNVHIFPQKEKGK